MAFKTPDKTSEYLRSVLKNANNDFLKELEHYADEHFIPILLPESVIFLKQLIGLKKPEKILEIGTAIGYSGIVMLNGCESSKLTTIELSENAFELAKANFKKAGVSERVTQIYGDAGEILPFLNGKFDFIFLDGPKSKYSEYLPYLKKLLNPSGILLCDNVLFNGMVAGVSEAGKYANLVKKLDIFIKAICADEDFCTSILPLGDGLSLSIKKAEEK